MEEHGKVICICPAREGISPRTNLPWVSQGYVIRIDGRYERNVYFSLWGADRIAKANIQLNEYITIKAEVEAHEHEGKWYNEIRAYDILKNGRSVFAQSAPAAVPGMPQPSAPNRSAAPTCPPYPTENEYNANNYAPNYPQSAVPAPPAPGYSPQR